MAAPKKRRAVSRAKHTKKAPAKFVATDQPRSWGREVVALFAAIAALLLLLALASELVIRGSASPLDEISSVGRTNWIGPVGHVVATILLGMLGWCGFLPALWLFGVAVVLYLGPQEKTTASSWNSSWVVAGLGLLASFAFFSAFCAGIGGRIAGGSVGLIISQPLTQFFNPFGAGLIALALFLLSLGCATRRPLGGLLAGGLSYVMALLQRGARLLMLGFRAVFNLISYFLAAVWGAIYDYFSGFSPKKWESETKLPRPRRHRNLIEISDQEEDFDDQEDEDDDDEFDVFTRQQQRLDAVIVKRRDQRRDTKKIDKIRSLAREQLSSTEAADFCDYEMPSLSLLTRSEVTVSSEDDQELRNKSKQIEDKLKDFGIAGHITEVHPGPVITLFEFEPAAGVKVGKIAALQDDLAMALRASSIRIVAPIPKKGTVGIEVPNKIRDVVRLRDVLESEAFINSGSILSVPIGKDTYGDPVIADIATMPHLLIAGATGTGKSVFLNALLLSLLYRATPAEMGLIMIDPKILELSVYEGVPHLRVPVVTAVRQAKAVLEWSIQEMNRRYRLMQRFGVRGIDGYNQMVSGEGESKDQPKSADKLVVLREQDVVQQGTVDPLDNQADCPGFVEKLKPLPKLVIVIDELADLMLSVGREVEELITRLAQKGRAAGLHLIVATQRPSVDVVTGLIKANFPARISFRVPSRIDSRTILDQMGAERLLGRGDMLFMLPGIDGIKRVHGAYISDSEVKRVVAALKNKTAPQYDQRIIDVCQKALEEEAAAGDSAAVEEGDDQYDPFYDKAVELVVQKGQASTSMVQRAFRIGYNRAARIIDLMEREGVVSPMDGVKPRQVLIPREQFEAEIDGVK